MSTAPNLLGWPGAVNQNTNLGFPTAPVQTPNLGPTGNPGNLPNPTSNIKDSWRNQAYLNTIQQQQRQGLIAPFANTMFGTGGAAANYYQNLMNLGSPYYQQQQRASFEQGVGQSQNAAAQARQQLSASGYGFTPSGTTAATIGEMGIGQSNTLEQAFLQNLFQNEQLQATGASGLAQLAALFNPASLFGLASPQTTQGQTPGETLSGIGSLASSLFKPASLGSSGGSSGGGS